MLFMSAVPQRPCIVVDAWTLKSSCLRCVQVCGDESCRWEIFCSVWRLFWAPPFVGDWCFRLWWCSVVKKYSFTNCCIFLRKGTTHVARNGCGTLRTKSTAASKRFFLSDPSFCGKWRKLVRKWRRFAEMTEIHCWRMSLFNHRWYHKLYKWLFVRFLNFELKEMKIPVLQGFQTSFSRATFSLLTNLCFTELENNKSFHN